MKVPRRTIVLLSILLVLSIALSIRLWQKTDASAGVDPALVKAAAGDGSSPDQAHPPVPPDPKRPGRARPSAMGPGR